MSDMSDRPIPRVVLFGATGFTGRLTAEAMVRAGLAPVLAGRSASRLTDLVDELSPLTSKLTQPTWQTADTADQASVDALMHGPGDVLVSTVGPFTRLGAPAIRSAINSGANYIDSTGESPFIREVFEVYGPRANETGASLLTAFGYDFVPGNLAGALALQYARDAEEIPHRIEVGYFVTGGNSGFGMSSGTKASAAATFLAPSFHFRQGRLRSERAGQTTRSFHFGDQIMDALSIGGSEHFALPRLDPDLVDVGVYLGWAGRWTKAASAAGGLLNAFTSLPGVSQVISEAMCRAVGDQTGAGPTAAQRSGSVSVAIARAFDLGGREVARVQVAGPTPYELTAELLTWAASMCLSNRTSEGGAFGPVDAFGLDELLLGCSDMGLCEVPA